MTKKWLAATSLLTILATSLFSQTSSTGALTGTLKDSSGAVVPNATVTANNIGTSQARVTTTSSDGLYKFGFLPPGDYTLKFEASGFTTAEVRSVKITVTETGVLDQVVQVGSQTQQVEVRGETEAVQTASSTVGTVISTETVTSMPLTTRNYTNLLGLAAGANVGVFNAANLGRGSQDIVVNGSSTVQNNYQQDGASIVNIGSRGNGADSGNAGSGIGIVNPDAVQEFKIQTSLFDAGYGRNPGANVNVVTKSGTNQFHGTAFEFFRNAVLNANDYFRKISPPVGGVPNNGRQVLNQNQYGGTLGGPVKKDKLFFFASFQQTSQRNGISPAGFSNPTLVGIPQGDRSSATFRAALGAAFCTGLSKTGGTQVACNGSNINQVALNILQLKLPNGNYYIPSSSNGGNQNTTFSLPAVFGEHQAIGNVDYVINSKNTVSGRWFYAPDTTTASMGCGTSGTGITQCLPGGPGLLQYSTQYAVLKLTSILSNNMVNELRFSGQRAFAATESQLPFTDTQVGITPIVPSYNVFNKIVISGLMQIGAVSVSQSWTDSVEAADQISWSHGRHTIRAGFEYERDSQNRVFPGLAIGSETFQTFQDFLLGLPGCSPVSFGNGSCSAAHPTDPATGILTNGTASSNISSSGTSATATQPGGAINHFRAPAASAFLQDDVKVSSKLTLNLGVRWEYNGLINDATGQLTNVWPSLISTVNVPVTQGGTLGTTPATGSLAGFVVASNYNPAHNPTPPVGGLFQSNQRVPIQNSSSKTSFAPRAGFAWKPFASDRFVVRGGAGYFYDKPGLSAFTNTFIQAYPYTAPAFQTGAANYFASDAQPYAPTSPGWAPRWVNISGQTGTSSNLNVDLMGPVYLVPTTYEWNLNTQYEFLPQWVLEVGYVGSRGIHQVPDFIPNGGFAFHQLNEAQLASPSHPINGITTNTVGNAAVRVPYLGFSALGLADDPTFGDSKFNSLQATVRKQMSHGIQMQAAYTYSRAFTNTAYAVYNDPNVKRYGPYAYYRPQRLAITYDWNLPLGAHEGLLGKVANGWNLSGVTIVQDGTPLTITDTRGGTVYGYGPGASQTSTAQFAAGMSAAAAGTSGGVSQRLGGATGGTGYFNKAAFLTIGPPVIGTDGKATGYGNTGYGIILGPGQFNFDAAIQKTTKVGGIHEDAILVFRTEFFNLFNHPQFSAPTGSQLDFSNASFGQITSESVNPRLIQFALKYVF
jgi:Carboxypeptidase regulatory-like domain